MRNPVEVGKIEQGPGWVDKMIGRVVHNVQIEIKDIYIRYEDIVSSNKKFALGLIIQSCSAVTTNSEWQEEYVSDSILCYKVCQLKNFSIFLDYSE